MKMKMKMKKRILFMLTLLVWCVASMNAQVRVGGLAEPNPAAHLDVNKDDNTTTGNNTAGLALPRVSLTSTTVAAPVGLAFVRGMCVYNTATAGTAPNNVIPGVYYSDGSQWVRISDLAAEIDGMIGNEINDVMPNRALYHTGKNTADFLVGIQDAKVITSAMLATGAVTSADILNGTIGLADFSAMGALNNYTPIYNGSAWTTKPKGLRLYKIGATSISCTSNAACLFYINALTVCGSATGMVPLGSFIPTIAAVYRTDWSGAGWHEGYGDEFTVDLAPVKKNTTSSEGTVTLRFGCYY
jgi:hypothetical protein